MAGFLVKILEVWKVAIPGEGWTGDNLDLGNSSASYFPTGGTLFLLQEAPTWYQKSWSSFRFLVLISSVLLARVRFHRSACISVRHL